MTTLPLVRAAQGASLLPRCCPPRSLRSKSQIHSVLDDIEGIGPARRKTLLAYFKDIDGIRTASLADLEIPSGMTKASAKAVYEFFHKNEDTNGNDSGNKNDPESRK